jgi:mannosyltransferase
MKSARAQPDDSGAAQSGEPGWRAGRKPELLVVAGPALLALGLCLVRLRGRSLGFDEAATVAIASEHGAALRSAIAHDGGNMSGYYVLLHLLISAFGHGGLVLRLPSAIAAGVAAGFTSALALRLFDRRVALAAGLLMAVSLPLVFWGQSARSYAFLTALSAGSFLAFSALLESPRPRLSWVAYVLCTTLALYASLMAVLIIPAQLLISSQRSKLRVLGAAIGTVAVLSVPLMILIAQRGSGQLFWVPRPNLAAVKQVSVALSSAGLEPSIRPTSTTTVVLVLTLFLLCAAAVGIAAGERGWRAWLVISWLAVPIALAVAESFVGPSIFVPRNLLIVLPAVALLLGWGAARLPAGGLVLAGLIALRALQLSPAYGESPEDWRAATAYVMKGAEPGDCIAFYPSDGRNAFRYYAHGHPPRSVLPAVPWTNERAYIENYATLTTLPPGCARLWLVSSHVGQVTGPARSRANLARYTALRDTLAARYPSHAAREFGYADAVTVEVFGPRNSL